MTFNGLGSDLRVHLVVSVLLRILILLAVLMAAVLLLRFLYLTSRWLRRQEEESEMRGESDLDLDEICQRMRENGAKRTSGERLRNDRPPDYNEAVSGPHQPQVPSAPPPPHQHQDHQSPPPYSSIFH